MSEPVDLAERRMAAAAKEVQGVLMMAVATIKALTPNPAEQARLVAASTSFMFGAACAAQNANTPAIDLEAIATSLAADLVDQVMSVKLTGAPPSR